MAYSGPAPFLYMWLVMTAVMMLPSLAPTLWRYRRLLAVTLGTRANWLTAVVGMGYFTTWMVVGLVVYPLTIVLESAAMKLPVLAHALPVAIGVVMLIAGAVQLTAWKARQLARCRDAATPGDEAPTAVAASWRHGLQLGWHCTLSCAGPMVSLLAIGMMDWRAMAVLTTAITLERLVPMGRQVARVTGVAGVVVGVTLLARALG